MSEEIVLKKLDEVEFAEDIDESLRGDNIAESCYTNFRDSLVEAVLKTIREVVQIDGWKVKAFEKNKEEKIFNAFMNNYQVAVLLSKKVDESKEKIKKVIIKLDFTEEEKKEIAKVYVNNILEGYAYLDLCLFTELEEINVDTISEALSSEVYQLLSPDEIKTMFKDKIEEAIRIINDENDVDDIDVDDINEEDEKSDEG